MSTKKVTKKSAMPLEETKGPASMDVVGLQKLQGNSNMPINLNIAMNVNEKALAEEMYHKIMSAK